MNQIPPLPVAPPTLADIDSIVQRRRNTRLRAGQLVGAIALTAGVTFAATNATRAPTEGGLADEPPAVEEPAARPLLPGCLTDGYDASIQETVFAARTEFRSLSSAQQSEAAILALEWGIPEIETEIILGTSELSGVEIGSAAFSPLSSWNASGRSLEELDSIADDWNVTSYTIKVLSALQIPSITDVINGCP